MAVPSTDQIRIVGYLNRRPRFRPEGRGAPTPRFALAARLIDYYKLDVGFPLFSVFLLSSITPERKERRRRNTLFTHA
jgi:hypothetical protein